MPERNDKQHFQAQKTKRTHYWVLLRKACETRKFESFRDFSGRPSDLVLSKIV